MSEDPIKDQISAFDSFGNEFGNDTDPLEQFDERFKMLEESPIDIYKEVKIRNEDITDKRIKHKIRVLDRWKTHMQSSERHPACPNASHVGAYIDREIARGIQKGYIMSQANIISHMFDYWIEHPKMPHGRETSENYNPVKVALKFKEDDISKNTENNKKAKHPMGIEEMGYNIRQIKNVLHRGVIATQFKYGLRVGQVSNLQKQDVKIQNTELNNEYSELGTHPQLEAHDEDVIYLAHRGERDGVKSKRPVVMPIDSELRRLLVQYLRQRPPVDKPWLFLNNASVDWLRPEAINNKMWKPYFRPKYGETEVYAPITSHYARHRFGTYWKKEIGANVEYIKYMRGDKQDSLDNGNPDILDTYVHTYYSDIRDLYLNNIYKFDI